MKGEKQYLTSFVEQILLKDSVQCYILRVWEWRYQVHLFPQAKQLCIGQIHRGPFLQMPNRKKHLAYIGSECPPIQVYAFMFTVQCVHVYENTGCCMV